MIDGINGALSRTGPIQGDARGRGVAAYRAVDASPVEARAAVSVSTRARLGAQVAAAARASDGVDAGRVNRLSAAVHSGTFAVSPDAIAGAMLGE